MSSSSSPCAACKLQRRKCTQECIFAPYFPADQPQKFANIHKVFGASNVAKLLNELNVSQREDAVNSLAYEADTRLRDPVYGCVGMISILQQRLRVLQSELSSAKKELANYIGPQALLPMIQPQQSQYMGNPVQFIGGGQMMAPHQGGLMMREQTPAAVHHHHHHQQQQQQQQQQVFEAQQLAAAVAAREQQETYRRQQDMRFNGGFDMVAAGVVGGVYGQGNVVSVSPSLALGGPFDGPYQIQGPPLGEQQPPPPPHNHPHLQGHHLSLQPQQGVAPPEQHDRSVSEEKCNGGPSC